jgi:uncharacterized protein (DUF427 family)
MSLVACSACLTDAFMLPQNAAWYYPSAGLSERAKEKGIGDRVAFWKGVSVQ